jgi:hypothetical protein
MTDVPIRLTRPCDVKYLFLLCDDCEVHLVYEGTLALPGPEVHQHKCPKCMKVFHTQEKVGPIFVPKEDA